MAGKVQRIRWTIHKAATEFGIDQKTLSTKLAEVEPGADKLYSTRQIADALFDDAKAEKVRLTQEQTRKYKLANDKKAGEQVDAETVFKAYEGVFICLRQTIMGSNMTDAEKAECLAQLRHDTMEAKPIE